MLLDKLDDVEESVNRMKMPLAYAGQFYVLREHIGFVRARLLARDYETPQPAAAKPAGAPPAGSRQPGDA